MLLPILDPLPLDEGFRALESDSKHTPGLESGLGLLVETAL